MKLSIRKFAGVKFIDFHTHRRTAAPGVLSIVSVELADWENPAPENPDNRFFSVGLHPRRLPENAAAVKDDLEKLCRALQDDRVIALGEAGLDRLRGPEMEVQEAYSGGVLRLAAELDKPVIVHCVRCYSELISLKKRWAPEVNMLVHGYNSNVQVLDELLRHGFYVSFGSAALKRAELCGHVRRKPEILSRTGLETDASDLTVEEIYQQAAAAFGVDVGELSRLMKNNFTAFFQVKDDV